MEPWRRDPVEYAACLLMSMGASWDPRPHTATPGSLQPSDTAQKAYGHLPTTKRGADLATKGTFHKRSSDAEISRAKFSKGDWMTPHPQLSWESQSLRSWTEATDPRRADGTTKALAWLLPKVTRQGVVHLRNCSLNPLPPVPLCPSPRSISCSGHITFIMFCKWGRTLGFLEVFEATVCSKG